MIQLNKPVRQSSDDAVGLTGLSKMLSLMGKVNGQFGHDNLSMIQKFSVESAQFN